MEGVKTAVIKLITICGDEIIIEVDEDILDDVDDEMLEKLENNELYFVGDHNETARYKGHFLTIIDMKKVIGRE